MPDAPDHMWPFWRDKLGAEAALREQFPEKLRRDPRLQSALRQLDTTRAAIEYIMGADPNADGPAHEGGPMGAQSQHVSRRTDPP